MQRVGATEETEEIEPIALTGADPFRPLPPQRTKPSSRPDPPPAAAEDGRGVIHTVSAGDTLAGIALR